MQNQPTVGLYFDTRYKSKKNEGKFPVKIRVTFETWINNESVHKPEYYDSKPRGGYHYLSPDDFPIVEKGSARGSLRTIQDEILAQRQKAKDIIEKNPRISITAFALQFTGKVTMSSKVKALGEEWIARKESIDKEGTAAFYRNGLASILEFGGQDLELTDITPEWIKEFEIWKTTKGSKSVRKDPNASKETSLATASMCLRALRRFCKMGLERSLITEDQYPFGGKYKIRKKRKKKKPASPILKQALLSYVPEIGPTNCKALNGYQIKCELEGKAAAVDFTMFSFLCNGMNFADMAYLEESNFHGDHFKFIRRKTKDTVLEQKEITVQISATISQILARRVKPGERYVFGIINDRMDAKAKAKAIKQWRKTTNKWLKRIAKELGHEGQVNAHLFRHLFTTMTLEAGVPITKVQDSLGHTSITTTSDYAEDLDVDTSKKFDSILIGVRT